MSENNSEGNQDQNLDENLNDDNGEQKPTYEELKAQLTASQSTNARQLKEAKEQKAKSQSYKQELNALKKSVSSEREKQINENGSDDEKVQMLQEKLDALQAKGKEDSQKLLTKELSLQVAKFAPDAQKLETLLYSVGQMKSMLELDEDTMTWSNVDQVILKLRETEPYLFIQDSKTGVINGRPGHEKPKDISINNYQNLTKEEKGTLKDDALAAFV